MPIVMPHSSRIRLPLILFAGVLALVAYNVANPPWQLRFAYVPLNYWCAAALATAVPGLLVWMSWLAPRRGVRIVSLIACIIVAVPFLIFACLALLQGALVKNNVDPAFQRLSEAATGSFVYRLYRTNCGATCDYGLALRKEIDLPFELRLVSLVWSKYHESEGIIEVIGEGIRVVHDQHVFTTISE